MSFWREAEGEVSGMDASALNEKESMVDPFLVEALQNPRHRLTILRMELEIRRFMQSIDQNHFEFQHFPTSYLRLAAHRVAQHYGLQTMVRDNGCLDGTGNRILAIKITESKFPAVRLSDIPAKQPESDKSEQIKVVLRHHPGKSSSGDVNGLGFRNSVRSMEERKEEYDKARARIFGGDETLVDTTESTNPSSDEIAAYRNTTIDQDKTIAKKEIGTSRVAILKDREKDCIDPDYDRSYERYARNIPFNQSFGLVPYNMQEIPHPFGHIDTRFSQLGHISRVAPGSLNYIPPSTAVMTSFCPTQSGRDVGYVQWPSAAMMYAHSYDQFRHGVFQPPVCQQPLSFDYSQHR